MTDLINTCRFKKNGKLIFFVWNSTKNCEFKNYVCKKLKHEKTHKNVCQYVIVSISEIFKKLIILMERIRT